MRGKAAPSGLMATPEGRQLKESQAGRITYTLESSLDSVNRVEQMAEEMAKKAGIDEDELYRITMAVREAAVNAVLHGNSYDPQKHMTASFENTGADLLIRSFMDEVHFKLLNPGTELTLVKHLGAAH